MVTIILVIIFINSHNIIMIFFTVKSLTNFIHNDSLDTYWNNDKNMKTS
jgi:hypothetical protein